MSDKKIVHYVGEPLYVEIGEVTFLKPVDHPNTSNTYPVKTSRVVAYDEETGVLETENTIYRRIKNA